MNTSKKYILRDRLIEAWREYFKEEGLLVMEDSGHINIQQGSQTFNYQDYPIFDISFGFTVVKGESVKKVRALFIDMYNSLKE